MAEESSGTPEKAKKRKKDRKKRNKAVEETLEASSEEEASKPNGKFRGLYKAYAYDPDICEKGVPLNFEQSDTVVYIKPSHTHYNPEYRDAVEAEETRLLAEAEEKGIVNYQIDYNRMGMDLAYVCICGWNKMLKADDTEMEFTRENARIVCEDIPFVKFQVAIAAANQANWRYKLDEDSSKT